MHRIWVGLDARVVLSAVGTAVTIMVLVIHLFAFKVVNHPGMTIAKYQRMGAAATK